MCPAPHESFVPAVMYHSVGTAIPGWPWGSLIVDHRFFARQVAALANAGYTAVGLAEVRERQERGRPADERQVVLTFDDGYLDNWVYVYPVLRRYGWRGVVYVNPEFVDPGETVRPNLDDVDAGRCGLADLPPPGFLNRAELRTMAASGVFTIASHSMTHTWYPTGAEIVDYHRPDSWYPWLAWNARPDRKHAYLREDQGGFVPLGTPVHRHGRSLGIRRYLPDQAIAEATTARVAAGGGAAFFHRENWRPTLDEVARTADIGAGRLETDDEMLTRFRWEILASRQALEAIIGAPVVDFAWPGGAYNDASFRIAQAEAGFATIVIKAADRARWQAAEPRFVRRISSLDSVTLVGRRFAVRDPGLLVLACDEARGQRGAVWKMRLAKVRAAVLARRQAGG